MWAFYRFRGEYKLILCLPIMYMYIVSGSYSDFLWGCEYSGGRLDPNQVQGGAQREIQLMFNGYQRVCQCTLYTPLYTGMCVYTGKLCRKKQWRFWLFPILCACRAISVQLVFIAPGPTQRSRVAPRPIQRFSPHKEGTRNDKINIVYKERYSRITIYLICIKSTARRITNYLPFTYHNH